MKINPQDLINCLSVASNLSQACYQTQLSPATVRSVDLLKALCERDYTNQVPIQVLQVDAQDETMQGCCLIGYPAGSATILLAHHLNLCWRRFVRCKELFHIALNRDEYHNINLSNHIEKIVLCFPDDDSNPEKSVQVELLAEFAAMEYLFPHEERVKILSKGELAAEDYKKIAEQYKIPLFFVERYLSREWVARLNPKGI